MPKPIDVSSASALDLRAQLASQRESFDLDRQKGKAIPASERRPNKKPTVWARQNKGVAGRAGKDAKVELEDVGGHTLEASRAALQRKAKLYDEMRKRKRYNDDSDDENQLIDFDRKQVSDSDNESETDGKDDPWVDYVDEYGRTRTVRQSQVPKPRSPSPEVSFEPAYPVFTTADRQSERKNEEEEESQRYNADQEIRTKGVGFYAFSKDEQERQAQMEELKRLREQTETARAHTMSVSAKRKQALERNAAKINARRLLLKQKATAKSSQSRDSSSTEKLNVTDESISAFLNSMRNK
ncbi:hypothetical protein Unana1_04893 [Umbelopsis nana]